MATMGWLSLMSPAEPKNGAVPKENTPPSRATVQYPCVASGGGGPPGPWKAATCVPAPTSTSPRAAAGVVKWLTGPRTKCTTSLPVPGSSPCRTPAPVSTDQTSPPATMGGPSALVGVCQAWLNEGALRSTRSALTPVVHGTYRNGGAQASPPKAAQAVPEKARGSLRAASGAVRNRYPAPDLPAWKAIPLPSSSGPVEPRSLSVALSLAHVGDWKKPSSWRLGARRSTLSVKS